jgi:hypothetical protein
MKNKNTILAVLITLGIVAVGISAYIKYAMPYLQEITLEKVDGERIQDLDTLNESLKEMEISVATSTVYVSLPSDDSACKTISDLPSLPDGWTYHCASETDYKNSNGTGWIPLNLSEKTGPERR